MSWLKHLDGLLKDLDEEESSVRQQRVGLQARLEALHAEAAEFDARLEEFAATRKTLLRMQQQRPAQGSTGSSAEHGEQQLAAPDATSGHGGRSSSQPRLSEADEQVVVLLAGRGEAMRAREVAAAVGVPDTRGRTEVMRSRLKRLTAAGWLAEVDRGLFAIAEGKEPPRDHIGVNGYGGEGGVPTSG